MNVILTCDNLNKKRVMVDNTCPVCPGHAESPLYLFVDCYIARTCWYSSKVGYNRGSYDFFGDWLSFMLNRRSIEDKQCVAMIMWQQ